MQVSQCETCQHALEVGGDWVDYGSTRVQTPTWLECNKDDWPEPIPEGDDDIYKLAEQGKCPGYKEYPHCKKHPEEISYPKWGCSKCEEEYSGGKDEH